MFFGGQVLGQALAAANYTVEERTVHSLHAYFLRKGDHTSPIIYEVDRQRDGRSFSSRRVVAIQHGRPILNLAASFQRSEEGLEHQSEMPDVPRPETLKDVTEYRRELLESVPESQLPRYLLHERPFEFRPVQLPRFIDVEPDEPQAQVWFKTVEDLPDDDNLHRNILAYVSDYYLIATRHPASRILGVLQEPPTREPRPRPVVSAQVPHRPLAPLLPGEPQRFWSAGARPRADLQ